MKKLNNLQALRAFAALNVVLFHIIGTSSRYGFSVDYLNVFDGWGDNGVDIFFVLSGFIMVYIQKDKPLSAARFFIDRFTRIAPLYWLMTVLLLAITYIFPSIFRSDISNFQELSLSSIFFVSKLILGKMPVLYDGWTLEYEMLFYFILTLGMLFQRKVITYLFVITVISSLIIFNLLDAVAYEFLFGILLGNLYVNFGHNKKLMAVSFVIGLIWFFSTLLLIRMDCVIFTQRVVMYGLSSVLIIYGLLGETQIKQGILTKLGDASYSIYLIQIFTISAFYKAINTTPLFDSFSTDILAFLCIFLTVISGLTIHASIEKPLTKLVRGFLLKKI
jgi:peptidoglycan/LPS O-acetylase OafA/YrhL